MKKIILFIVRRVLSLRYKVSLHGQEHLSHDGPILVLANHVALVEPRIIMSFLGKYAKISPLASEDYYNKPVLHQVMKSMGTVPIGNMSAGASADEVYKVFERVVDAMQEGKNILIYPSGQIYRQGYESIKGKQSVYHIAQHMPKNTKVLCLRTRGLWGSIWSKAWDNGATGFGKAYIRCIGYVFANLIFFVPKRQVQITLNDVTREITAKKTRSLNEFNSFLEDFLNTENSAPYIEEISYIPHYFYYNDVKNKVIPELITGSEQDLKSSQLVDTSKIDASIKEDILQKIALIKELDAKNIQETSILMLDLFFDSLDTAEIKSYIQSHFDTASNPPITSLKSVGDLFVMAAGLSKDIEELKDADWGAARESQSIIESFHPESGDSILSLWKKNFKHSKKDIFMWDNIFGSQSKKDVIIKAYVVSHYIKKIPGDYIGIMLPSVGSASLVILASYLAGKTPVMFNWTLGKDAFDHCVNFSKVETILTSRNFFEKINTPFLQEYHEAGIFDFLEDMLKSVPNTLKISSLVKSFYLPIPKLPETAVILFTSGSESLPKAIALTHTNLIENIAGVFSVFDLKTDDRLLGFLPPFHSFGFTVNTIMPLITGLQVVYTPDPNDSKTILEIIKHTGVSGITATPTFLKMILSLAENTDLESIRYGIVGAEKCPEDVFSKFKTLAPNGVILEGYGITECSPVVSINPISDSKPGTVGKIIPNLDCILLDIESQERVPTGEQGMIFVSGSSIFAGYLDADIENPFEEIDGKSYYKTGDLGRLDEDGFLTITGRLKRFIKIAGEMVSLPFVEGILQEKYQQGDVPSIAIEALEQDGESKICIFSVDHIETEDANAYLRERGVSNLIKISQVIHIEEIPVLGTGKTDYKVLKGMISFG